MTRVALTLVLLTLAGCASTRTVTLEVREGDGAATGALVRAIPLNEGFVPLPLNEETLNEILLAGKKTQQGIVGDGGAVRLVLRADVPYVVEVLAPAWRSRELDRWMLDADGVTIESADAAPGRYAVRVVR